MTSLPRFRKRFSSKPGPVTPHETRPRPVDPELSRRVGEVRRQIEHTRRQLKLHVLPDRKRQTSRDGEAATEPRPIQGLPPRDGQEGGK
jgi:hypothetical protein